MWGIHISNTLMLSFYIPLGLWKSPVKDDMYGLSFAILFSDTNLFRFSMIYPLLAFASIKDIHFFILGCDWDT